MTPTLIMQALAPAPLACALMHISEEFVIPGGFIAWIRRRGDPHRRLLSVLVG